MNALSPIQIETQSPLDVMLADIDAAAHGPLETRHLAIAAAIAPHLGNPRLLEGRDCPCNPARYSRHLLHADPAGAYAVVALVWAPGQMSPVHGHRTWCALGIHRGFLSETFFRPEGDIALPTGCRACAPGTVSHAPADPLAIHRLANLGTQEAVSVHVYGVAFDSFGEGVNEVWAA
jgi:predicted metal-dependent enzyme (double-stranded beta helix superfamily)